MFSIEPISIIIFTLSIVIVSFSFIIYIGTKDYSSHVFALFIFLVGLWITFRGGYHTTPQQYPEIATALNYLSFSTGMIVATLFTYFTLVFPENKKPSKKIIFFLIFLNIAAIPVYLYGNLFLGPTVWVGGIEHWKWLQGAYLIYYDMLFTPPWLIGFYILYKKSKHYTGKTKKGLQLMLWTTILMIGPVEVVSLILPRFFNYFKIEWLSSITVVGWISLLSYSIVKHNQMNVKTILTELLIIICIILLFISIFL